MYLSFSFTVKRKINTTLKRDFFVLRTDNQFARDRSPKVVATPNAMLGLSKGEITIAPIITTSLFCTRPMAAIAVPKITNKVEKL